MLAKTEALQVASVYASIDAKTKQKTAGNIDIKKLKLVKGKKGKLGRGSHGQVKVSTQQKLYRTIAGAKWAACLWLIAGRSRSMLHHPRGCL